MSVGFVIELMRNSVLTILTVAAPVLLVAMGVGLITSIIQATTSIQDQTLTFVPKIIAILITLSIIGGWMVGRLSDYTTLIFRLIPEMAG